MEPPTKQEMQVWKEWFINSVAVLGQWDEIEECVHSSCIGAGKDALTLWSNTRLTSSCLSPLVNSKLMRILSGAEHNGGLLKFVNESRSNDRWRQLLEDEVPLQLAVLAVHQEKFEEAQMYLTSAQMSLLARLTRSSLLTPKPIFQLLNGIHPLVELNEFVHLIQKFSPSKAKSLLKTWCSNQSSSRDNLLQSQFVTAYRDLYCHFLRQKLSSNEKGLIYSAKAASHKLVVETAIANNNPHLAYRHLVSLEKIPKDELEDCNFYFLKVEASVIRANQKEPEGKLKYLIEAWSKSLNQVDAYLNKNKNKSIEANYLTLESSLLLQICQAINDWNQWQPNHNYMTLIGEKFSLTDSSRKEYWCKALLECSARGLEKCASILECDSQLSTTQQHHIYTSLTSFYESCLEDWASLINPIDFMKGLIKTVLHGMFIGSKDAHFKFPRLIYLVEQNPELIPLFVEQCDKVPTWMFILWLSHLLIYVNKTPGPAVRPIIMKVAQNYPQAVIYSYEVRREIFHIDSENDNSLKVFCNQLEQVLQEASLVYDFISAISRVQVPHLEIKDFIKEKKKFSNKNELVEVLKKCYEKYLKISKPIRNTPGERGAVYIKPDDVLKEAIGFFERECGTNAAKISSLTTSSLKSVFMSMERILDRVKSLANKLPRTLASYSPWLANFNGINYKEEIEIPGQYDGLSKPMPDYHVKISTFSENVHIMTSIRLPIKIVIYGNDEKEHPFLVKAGEDLRTDERMESMFSLFNNIFEGNSASNKLSYKPYLNTYKVIPFSQKIGILQWVDHTLQLFNFITDEVGKVALIRAEESYNRTSYYNVTKSISSREKVVRKYEDCVNCLPWDLLRNGIFKLSTNYEGFFYLRNSFSSSFASLCISHWILGIGDRHLSNYLISLKTGRIIGIDFGHHFHSATQFLPVPELMPFRMTQQIVNVMQPFGVNGLIRETMIACLAALKSSRLEIIAAIEAFVKEPTEDWLQFVSSQEGCSDDPKKIEQFSCAKMAHFVKKLSGYHPSRITAEIIAKNRNIIKEKRIADYQAIALGSGYSNRSHKGEKDLSIAEQVDILIEMATDPNILGRTWVGWKPFL